MKAAILKHDQLKLFRHIFFGIITSQILNINMKLVLETSLNMNIITSSFNKSILRSINTRCLMKAAILKHEQLKLFRHIFFGIITSQILNINMKLSVNINTEGTKVRK